jgi:hypothetical protein
VCGRQAGLADDLLPLNRSGSEMCNRIAPSKSNKVTASRPEPMCFVASGANPVILLPIFEILLLFNFQEAL